ncbi:hypothetical protein BDA99DRAFT_530882, partial [Phascolomyces articulosus]
YFILSNGNIFFFFIYPLDIFIFNSVKISYYFITDLSNADYYFRLSSSCHLI